MASTTQARVPGLPIGRPLASSDGNSIPARISGMIHAECDREETRPPAVWVQPAAESSTGSKLLQQTHAELARRTGEVETGVHRRDIVLVAQVAAVQRRDPGIVLPLQLRAEQVACGKQVAHERIVEQGRPL